ncbi:MAG: efflux RND transporter permease subunit [Isosphaeraceae bacterium]
MISRFFIDRPIFATVLSVVITIAGGVSLSSLPLSLYPPISPPTVSVDCNYPGASAQVVSESVATPIEQYVNGVENMLYMSSQCTNDGGYNLTVTFKQGVNLNMAQVLVQNRVALALPSLPDVLKQSGVNVRKRSPDILLSLAINSPDLSRNQLELSNFALMKVRDEILRVPGVSDVFMLGQRDYSMRIWVDPDRLAMLNLTAGDVVAAVRSQNMQVASGQIGQQPAPLGQDRQIPLSFRGRLVDPEEFEMIVIKSTEDGRVVRVKDVARVELGAKNHDVTARVNNKPCVSMAVFQLPDGNALETAIEVKRKIHELSRTFPPGIGYEIRYDTTPFISESINEVGKTLFEAVVLVAVVVLLFLQNWRSALIPLLAVPVAVVGTFAVMAAFGFSLNNLTLFGLVLAIGIVVDDAIVVVEAVEHHIEHGLAPRDATIRAMEQVSGPVIAIGLVLSAVFVPCAFITGIVGQFFRQFALTIATSTIISTFNSLTLSPALAALLLKSKEENDRRGILPIPFYIFFGGLAGWFWIAPVLGPMLRQDDAEALVPHLVSAAVGGILGFVLSWPADFLLSLFFRGFNATFRSGTRLYGRLVGGLLRGAVVVLLLYCGMLWLTWEAFRSTPAGFIPSQDMGYLLCNVQLPDSSAAERTVNLMARMEEIAHGTPGVKHTQAMAGQSLLLSANGSNFGSMFVILDEFAKRPNPVLDRFLSWFDEAVTSVDQRVEGFYRFLKEPTLKLRPVLLVERPYVDWRPLPVPVPFRSTMLSWLGPSEKMDRLRNRINPPGIEKTIRRVLNRPKQPSLYGDAVAENLRKNFAAKLPGAMITVLPPPPIRGVGRAGGFKLMVEDRGDNPPAVLQEAAENLLDQCKTNPSFVGMTSVFRSNVPQLFVDVDREACLSKGVAMRDLFDTMRIYLGSLYVNDFNRFGRTWQVIVQADERFRNSAESVRRLRVRNAEGDMVPLGTLATVREQNGPLILTRYNMHPAAPLNGSAAPGVSSGEAIQLLERLASDPHYGLPPSMAYEWTELAFLEIQAGNTAMIVFGFAVVMVFLVLAAQYESWSLPLAVILVVPMCLLSAVVGVKVSFQDINIFTQIGFVVLVGLASKNAILIVEFAKARRDEGETRRQAALDACVLRLRPILMTSFAFILGVLPLLLTDGAGAEMRRTLGTTVFSGMLGVTVFGIVLTPVFFVAIDWLGTRPAFRSPAARRASEIAFWVLLFVTGGWVFRMLRTAAADARQRRASTRPARSPRHRREPVSTTIVTGEPAHSAPNGNGSGNGEAHSNGQTPAEEIGNGHPNGNGSGNGHHDGADVGEGEKVERR